MKISNLSVFRAVGICVAVGALVLGSVPLGASPAQAATAGMGACAQTVDNATGVVVDRVSDDCVIQFTRVGTTEWTIPAGVTRVSTVIVGGGGGGGAWVGAGGGAGGVVAYGNVFATLPATNLLAISPGAIDVVVGGGGSGANKIGSGALEPGTNGEVSSLGNTVAHGGGVGGSLDNQAPNNGVSPVGSGGGGANAVNSANRNGGPGTPGQGFSGGSGHSSHVQPHASGGGGGAGGSGGDASQTVSGDGGPGVTVTITGASLQLAGGGGGGIHGPGGSAGSASDGGGSGAGGSSGATGGAGIANTGGGGGGSGADVSLNSTGGAGGSGIVIVRYALTPDAPTGLSAASNDPGEITLTYTAPTYTGGPAGSLLQYSTDSGVSWRALGDISGSTTISVQSDGDALVGGESYVVELRAENDAEFVSTAVSASAVTVAASQQTSGPSGGDVANDSGDRGKDREKQASSPAIYLDLQITPGQQISGARVVIGGQGLAAGSNYSLVLRSTPQTLASGQASALGNFSKQVSMPALAPGSHTLTLTAIAPDGSTLSLVQGFTVGADGTVTALGSPAGTAGSALAATGSDQLVMLWSVGLAMLLLVAGVSTVAVSRPRPLSSGR